MGRATDHEVVSIYRHSDEQLELLLCKAPECVLMWGTKDHWPVGVVHSYVGVRVNFGSRLRLTGTVLRPFGVIRVYLLLSVDEPVMIPIVRWVP